jgi:tetratricopeptide (TPR) repeat protein
VSALRRASRAFASLCLAAALATASAALAQTTQSDELFQKGREAAKRGDYAAACAFFGESYALDASAGTLFNLAHCEEQLRRVATAWNHYRELAERLPKDDPRLARVEERLQALEPRLPRLSLVLAPDAPEGARVSLDGKEVEASALGTPVVVDPGNHAVEVTAPDRLAKRYDLIIAESENRSLNLAVGDPRPPAPPPTTTRPKPRETAAPPPAPSPVAPERGPDWQRITGWSALGLGAAGLATTAIAAAIVLDRKATVEEECKDAPDGELVCSPDGKDAAENGKIWGTVGTVAFIIGVAGAGAGSYLLLTADGSDSHGMLRLQARF